VNLAHLRSRITSGCGFNVKDVLMDEESQGREEFKTVLRTAESCEESISSK
jgi:hypothetical protein